MPAPKKTQRKKEVDTRESLTVKLTTEEKRRLARAVMKRKLADSSLPVRWGLSDYARELILDHLATANDE